MSAERPKVVFVMGSGRSGSSILGVALGNCDRVFYGGELAKWLWRSGVPFPGSTEESESFWRTVREQVVVPDELSGEKGRRASVLERTAMLFDVRHWPDRRRLRAGYLRVTGQLFSAIARTADADWVVDTSHHPLRAIELQRIDGAELDLYLVYLVRDPQGVVASVDPKDRTSYSKSALAANAHLSVTHVLSLLAFGRQPRERRVFLRHEDFVADPDAIVRELMQRIGCAGEVPDTTALQIGMPLMGNRFLKRGPRVVAVRRTTAPVPRHSRVTTLLQLPWEPVLARLRPTATGASGAGARSAAAEPVAAAPDA